MKRVFIAASWCHSDGMVAKDVIITLIAGIGELIGMTSFKSLGPTCSQITKETQSRSFYSVRRQHLFTFNIAFETSYNTPYLSTCYLFFTPCPPSYPLLRSTKTWPAYIFFHCSIFPVSSRGRGFFFPENQPLN